MTGRIFASFAFGGEARVLGLFAVCVVRLFSFFFTLSGNGAGIFGRVIVSVDRFGLLVIIPYGLYVEFIRDERINVGVKEYLC